jgi:hypothetical protein
LESKVRNKLQEVVSLITLIRLHKKRRRVEQAVGTITEIDI